MFKKLISLLLIFALVLTFAACGKDKNPSDNPSDDSNISSETNSEDNIPLDPKLNILTGEKTLAEGAAGKKPVAVIVNNIRIAQAVQSGLQKADVVFETEVEGGITRLLAFFADPTGVEKIGSVRSLRVVFAELAAGMNAVVVHAGMDPTYCRPHLATLNIINHSLSSKGDGFRENNGLASEHTLFTSGDRLDTVIANKGKDEGGNKRAWLNFRDSEEKKAPSEQKATKITAKFSGSAATDFLYDAKELKYARARKGVEYTDAATGERELFTNVFVLKTPITPYPNNVHKYVDLTGGEGYYASAGGIVPIKWTKGSSEENFKFTNTDGSPLVVNQGNSYVCIMSDAQSVTFE